MHRSGSSPAIRTSFYAATTRCSTRSRAQGCACTSASERWTGSSWSILARQRRSSNRSPAATPSARCANDTGSPSPANSRTSPCIARSSPDARSTCNERTQLTTGGGLESGGPPCAMIVTMAYDKDLANRIRELIASEDGYTEQKTFGGIGYMIDGHMALGVSGEGGLMIHCSKEETEGSPRQARCATV